MQGNSKEDRRLGAYTQWRQHQKSPKNDTKDFKSIKRIVESSIKKHFGKSPSYPIILISGMIDLSVDFTHRILYDLHEWVAKKKINLSWTLLPLVYVAFVVKKIVAALCFILAAVVAPQSHYLALKNKREQKQVLPFGNDGWWDYRDEFLSLAISVVLIPVIVGAVVYCCPPMIFPFIGTCLFPVATAAVIAAAEVLGMEVCAWILSTAYSPAYDWLSHKFYYFPVTDSMQAILVDDRTNEVIDNYDDSKSEFSDDDDDDNKSRTSNNSFDLLSDKGDPLCQDSCRL